MSFSSFNSIWTMCLNCNKHSFYSRTSRIFDVVSFQLYQIMLWRGRRGSRTVGPLEHGNGLETGKRKKSLNMKCPRDFVVSPVLTLSVVKVFCCPSHFNLHLALDQQQMRECRHRSKRPTGSSLEPKYRKAARAGNSNGRTRDDKDLC